MNIAEKAALWNHFRFQLPLLIAGFYVVINQRQIIWNTLKTWWSWSWEWKKWTSERINYMIMYGVGVAAFILTVFIFSQRREQLTLQQQQQVVEKMKAEKLITQEEIDKELQKQRERDSAFRSEIKKAG